MTGTFGGEGSGGQSYLVYDWKANTTYGFLTKATPNSDNSTSFIAWFNEPNNKNNSQWKLIAHWKRPKTKTYLTGLYSFIECFDP